MRWVLGWIGLVALAALAAASARAGEFNPVLSIGDAAPDWADLPGVDGQTHSLSDYRDRPVLVIVFTCNSCPYAVDYEDRLIGLAQKHAGPKGPAHVVAINANTIAEDRLPAMQARAKEKGYSFPYLFDESQQVAKAYGATFTPEFFVFDRDRKLVYTGAFDDKADPKLATKRYVEDAVEAALRGEKPAVAETVAIGCLVRYNRDRRRRDER